MSILTNGKINQLIIPMPEREITNSELATFARAIEAAVIKRLAGVSVEPVAYRAWFDKDNGARWLFTLWPEEERLDVDWEALVTLSQLQTALAAARVQMNDACAKVCARYRDLPAGYSETKIRSLLGKEQS